MKVTNACFSSLNNFLCLSYSFFVHEIIFYEFFIVFCVVQFENFQALIEGFFVNIVEKIKAVISASNGIYILDWITIIKLVSFSQFLRIFNEFLWWRQGKTVKVINEIICDECRPSMCSRAISVIETDYAGTRFA